MNLKHITEKHVCFLNDESCIVKPTFIYMNPNELKCYPLVIILNKCTGSCDVLSPKICVPKQTKDKNIKGYNIITNKDEAKAITENISSDCKCKSNSVICNLNQTEW